jgi:hypothetical protein
MKLFNENCFSIYSRLISSALKRNCLCSMLHSYLQRLNLIKLQFTGELSLEGEKLWFSRRLLLRSSVFPSLLLREIRNIRQDKVNLLLSSM